MMKGLFSSRRFRQGSMATAITAVVVALIIVINFLATALTSQFSLTLDLTPNKLFSITAPTKEFLGDLDKDVTITVLNTEEAFAASGAYYLQALEVLKKFALESPRIKIEYKDYVADPTIAQKYPDLQLSSYSILVSSGDRVRDITPYDLYDIQSDMMGNGQVTASRAEQAMASAILGVTSDKLVNVAVITGHNEEPIPSLETTLRNNNYMVEQVNLLTEEIDPAYAIAIVCAPTRDFGEDELKKLDRFLSNDGQYGKTLFYCSPSEQTNFPNLSAFLADWGIAVDEGFVFETNSQLFYPGDPFMAVVQYAESIYSEKTSAASLIPFTAYSRPIRLLFENKGTVTTATLLEFSNSAGIATADTTALEPSGSVPHLVMSTSHTYDGTTPLSSHVVVAGSSAMISQQFFDNPNFANSQYLLNLLGSLADKEEGISIQPKAVGTPPLNISAFQAIITGIVFTILFPLAVLIFGIFIWLRRRHL